MSKRMQKWLSDLTDKVKETDPSYSRYAVYIDFLWMRVQFGHPSYDWSTDGLQVWADEITNPLNY